MSDSPLLRLPAELRNTIYELALPTNDIIHIREHARALRWEMPALLQICQQMRLETTSVYYSSNIFNIKSGTRGAKALLFAWLRVLGFRCRSYLRTVRLDQGLFMEYQVKGRILECRDGLETESLQIDGAEILVEIYGPIPRLCGPSTEMWRSA